MTTLSLPLTKSHSLIQVIVALVLGTSFVFASGFANSQVLHDAAHDVRHSTGFPCH